MFSSFLETRQSGDVRQEDLLNDLESWAFYLLVLCMSAPTTASFERSFYIGNAFAGILYGMLKNPTEVLQVFI